MLNVGNGVGNGERMPRESALSPFPTWPTLFFSFFILTPRKLHSTSPFLLLFSPHVNSTFPFAHLFPPLSLLPKLLQQSITSHYFSSTRGRVSSHSSPPLGEFFLSLHQELYQVSVSPLAPAAASSPSPLSLLHLSLATHLPRVLLLQIYSVVAALGGRLSLLGGAACWSSSPSSLSISLSPFDL